MVQRQQILVHLFVLEAQVFRADPGILTYPENLMNLSTLEVLEFPCLPYRLLDLEIQDHQESLGYQVHP